MACTKWISVKDKLPDKEQLVIAFGSWILESFDGEEIYHYRLCNFDGLDFRSVETTCKFTYVTHWMPLPQPPKE